MNLGSGSKSARRVRTAADRGDSTHPFLESVRRKVQRQAFDTWFRPLRVDSVDEASRILYLFAPDTVLRDWIIAHYSTALDDSLNEIMLGGYRIEWAIDSHEAPMLMATAPKVPWLCKQVALTSASAAEMGSLSHHSPTVSVGLARPVDRSLNAKYTFDAFVVGSCNQFAHAAAQAIADAPGKAYNPFYIYGGVGLGKTHLMQAIGHAITTRNSSLSISYISLERFMNELINSIRYGYEKTHAFRERYRSIDVLLVDDIQFIAGKERTQEEFFHTFNALYDSQKQIVISSDCPPREIPNIEERLHSRFEWGLIADIEPPDLETKVAILRRKADSHGVILPDEVALYIASSVKQNIRELEGSLVRLLAISSLRGLPISKMLAQDAIRSITDSKEDRLSISTIQRAVAAHYKMRVEDITTKSNARNISLPRQVAMYLSKRLTKNSYPEIGRQFAGKHHTTVIHSVEKIERLAGSNPDFHKVLSSLIDTLCR
jgi:chromosomal replication initiator protein